MEKIIFFVNFFYNLFFEKNLKNDFYVNNFLESIEHLLIFIQVNTISFIFFILFLILNFYLVLKKNEKYFLILLINIIIFFYILYLFPINIPFTDTYNELNLLFSTNALNYVLNKDQGYFFILFRLFHLIIYEFFNLNYYIIIILNFVIYCFSFLLILKYIKIKNLENYSYIFICIYFCGKFFIIFYEPVNIVWTINLLTILLFVHLIEKKNIFFNQIMIFFVFFISIVNFKAAIILMIYSVIYGACSKDKLNVRIYFAVTPILLFYLVQNYLNFDNGDHSTSSLTLIFHNRNFFDLILNFLSMHVIAFSPFIFEARLLLSLFALLQYIYISFFIFSIKDNLINKFRIFIVDNPFLIIGAIGCLLTTLYREDYNQSRYVSFSLIFQMGFIILFLKYDFLNRFVKKLKKNIFILILLFFYYLNLFSPHQGFFFALGKNHIFSDSKKCFEIKNEDDCLEKMFYATFYDINQSSYKYFKNSLLIIYNQRLSLFSRN